MIGRFKPSQSKMHSYFQCVSGAVLTVHTKSVEAVHAESVLAGSASRKLIRSPIVSVYLSILSSLVI